MMYEIRKHIEKPEPHALAVSNTTSAILFIVASNMSPEKHPCETSKNPPRPRARHPL